MDDAAATVFITRHRMEMKVGDVPQQTKHLPDRNPAGMCEHWAAGGI